jgi:hypothetical protein
MSDVGVISHEYQRSSELAKKINDALIVVKKAHYQLPSSSVLSDEEISSSQQFLINVLRKLLKAFSAKAQVDVMEPSSEIDLPGSLLQRIRTKQKPKLIYYLADLRKAAEHLEQGVNYLTDSDLGLLDDMCAAIDIQTATIFQKFWKE